MSRSGYTDDCDGSELAMWRGQVASAMRGKRGQKLLRDFVSALDDMPEKRLGRGALKDEDGCMCSLGVVADARGLDMADVKFDCDPDGWDGPTIGHKAFAERFDVASQLTKEIMFENDEGHWDYNETPEQRWSRMRRWAIEHIATPSAPETGGEG